MNALQSLIVSLADAYFFIIFVYIMMSWIPFKKGIVADIDTVLGKICDPYLDIFRKFIPPIGGMLDISPIFALLVLQFGVRLIVSIL